MLDMSRQGVCIAASPGESFASGHFMGKFYASPIKIHLEVKTS